MTLNYPSAAPNAHPPGWYADPTGPGTARWWSGQDWTPHVQPLPTLVPVAPPSTFLIPQASSYATRALVWGIVAMVINALLAPSVLAIVYGSLALRDARRLGGHGAVAPHRGSAIAGIILGGVGAVGAVALTIAFRLWLASSH